MNKRQLKTAVRLLRDAERRIQPDAAWVARTRNVLLKEVRRDASGRIPVSFGERTRALLFSFVPRTYVDFVRGPVMAVVSVIGVLLGGSLASVSAAERSIPGDLLYPVKLATEQARLFMEKEPPNQLKLKTEFVERRGQEIKQLASNDTPQRPERIKEATDSLKQDLDAVKQQLHSVASKSTTSQVVEAAKDVDEKSGRLAQTLKEVRETLPDDLKANVTEVQAAALNTGVKAVQVLIDTHDDPGAQQIVSSDELKRTVSQHVQGLEDGIADTAKKVAAAVEAGGTNASTTALTLIPTASASVGASSTTAELLKGPLDQLQAARASLEETRQLLKTDQFDAIKNKLGEAATAITAAEKSATSVIPTLPNSTSSSTSDVGASGGASTTVPTASSTNTSLPAGGSASTTSSTNLTSEKPASNGGASSSAVSTTAK